MQFALSAGGTPLDTQKRLETQGAAIRESDPLLAATVDAILAYSQAEIKDLPVDKMISVSASVGVTISK